METVRHYKCKRQNCNWKSKDLPENRRCPKCNFGLWQVTYKYTSISSYVRDDPNVGECDVPEHTRNLGTYYEDIMPKDIMDALLRK